MCDCFCPVGCSGTSVFEMIGTLKDALQFAFIEETYFRKDFNRHFSTFFVLKLVGPSVAHTCSGLDVFSQVHGNQL